MSGQTRWSQSSVAMEHPDDSILLAYTREQALDESWPGIEQHIDTCEKCSRRSLEYAQIGAELSETLADFQHNQDYPPLTERVFDLIQNGATTRLARQEREQARRGRYMTGKLPFRPVLVPGMALLLVLLFASIVLAARADWPYLDRLIAHPGQNNVLLLPATGVKSPTARSAANQSGTNSATGTVTPDRGPTIRMCTKSTDSAQSRVRLCGNNFTPGDKVQVVVHLAGGGSRTLHSVLVDAQGRFQASWNVAGCKDVPVVIDVQGKTTTTEASLDLQG